MTGNKFIVAHEMMLFSATKDWQSWLGISGPPQWVLALMLSLKGTRPTISVVENSSIA